jgi:AcrR family transcriptional regulator
VAGSEIEGEGYAERLRRASNGEGGQSKRDRTRASLKLAALDLLRTLGLRKLTVTGVTRKANVAGGTFYTHFETLDELVVEVLQEFLDCDVKPAVPWTGDEHPFDALRNAFLPMIRHFRANLLIFRAVHLLRGEDKRISALWAEMTAKWARQFARFEARHNDPSDVDERLAIMLGHAATSLFDEFTMRVYVDKAKDLAEFANHDERIAEAMAIFRYRLLLGKEVPVEKLTVMQPFFAQRKAAKERPAVPNARRTTQARRGSQR